MQVTQPSHAGIVRIVRKDESSAGETIATIGKASTPIAYVCRCVVRQLSRFPNIGSMRGNAPIPDQNWAVNPPI